MKFRPTYRSIWGVSLPIIAAGISEMVVDITDTIFLAHYGITELAAIGLADAIYGLALFLTLGLVDGIQIVIGRRAGEGRAAAIGEVFNQGVYLLLMASLLMILVIVLVVPHLTLGGLSSRQIHEAVNGYLGITAYALVFQALNLACSAFYIGISRTRVLVGAALVLMVSNISLDYLLIFGAFGAPELGIRGAAIASLSAEILTFVYLGGNLFIGAYAARYGLFHFGRWDGALAAKLAAISMPVSLDALIDTGKWLLLIVILERLGERTLAAANIIFSCYALFLIPVESVSETVCSMVSNLIGQHQVYKTRMLIRRSIGLSYLVVAPFVALTLLFPDTVLALFSDDSVLIDAAVNGLIVIALISLAAVPANIHYAAVAGTGDTRITLATQCIASVLSLGYAWQAAFGWALELHSILLAELVGWVCIWLISWLWMRAGYWSRLEI